MCVGNIADPEFADWSGCRLPTVNADAVRRAGTVAGLLVLGVVCFFVAKSLVASETTPDRRTAAPTSTAPSTESPTDSIKTPSPSPSPTQSVRLCRTTPVSSGLYLLEPTVVALHDAACRGAFEDLLPNMSDPFGAPLVPKEEAIDAWTAESPGSDPLALLAETLETPVRGYQGGQYFCHPAGAVAMFARPIGDQPTLLSDFDPTGQDSFDICRMTP